MVSTKYILLITIFFNNLVFSVDSTKNDIENKLTENSEKVKENSANQNVIENELELLDKIQSEVTVVNGDNLESNIITKREVERSGFDGNVYTVQDLEDRILADQFSKILKANITNDDINRNLKRNGMTENDIILIAERWGFLNKDDFFDELKRIYRANAALNFEVESHLISSQDEIKSYYVQHSQEYIEEAKYTVETAVVAYPNIDQDEEDNTKSLAKFNKEKEKIKKELEKYIKSKISKPAYVNWDLPVEICQNEIVEDNKFLTDMHIGSIYMKESPSGFILYKMKNKKLTRTLPLENVQEDIVMKLKKEKYPAVICDVKNKLRSQAIIVHPE